MALGLAAGSTVSKDHLANFQTLYMQLMNLELQQHLSALHLELTAQITTQKPNVAKIGELLQQLQQQLSEQFKAEEQDMSATDYPYLLLHRHQHQRALENITRHIELWKKQRNAWALRDFVARTFTQWLYTHRRADMAATLFVAYVQEETKA